VDLFYIKDIVFHEGFFEVVGALVVENVEFECEPIGLELGVQFAFCKGY
jgi:hypothetical protein